MTKKNMKNKKKLFYEILRFIFITYDFFNIFKNKI